MKLQKYLAHAGVASRRKAEEYITQGLVTVNGTPAHIGQIIDPDTDKICVDKKTIHAQEKLVYYILNKPRGVTSTVVAQKSQESEISVIDIVDIPERVFPIGRLDKDTTGLLLLTNDGRLSNYLIHPRYEHEKEYLVEVYGKIEEKALEKMERGVRITLKKNGTRKQKTDIKETKISTLQYMTRPCSIKRLSSSKFSIILKEGKNRQIRRMVSALGYDVKKLKRIRMENILLGDMKEGEYRTLSHKEQASLFAHIGLPTQQSQDGSHKEKETIRQNEKKQDNTKKECV